MSFKCVSMLPPNLLFSACIEELNEPLQYTHFKLQALEKNSRSTGTSNMFIETPYRNGVLYEALLSCLHNETRLCIAVNITAADEWIKTKTIGDWKKSSTDLPKSPALFIIGK